MRLVLGGIACALGLAACFVKPDDRPGGGAVTYVHTFAVAYDTGTPAANPFQFQGRAANVNDAVVLHIGCSGPVDAGTWLPEAPGWSFRQIGPSGQYENVTVELIAAIGPTTDLVTFTIAFPTTCDVVDVLGDEFTGNDPNPATVIDAYDVTAGTGDATTTVTSTHEGDAVWAACTSRGHAGTGAAFAPAADDLNGDVAEYVDPPVSAGTTTMLVFPDLSGTTDGYVVTAASIKPR